MLRTLKAIDVCIVVSWPWQPNSRSLVPSRQKRTFTSTMLGAQTHSVGHCFTDTKHLCCCFLPSPRGEYKKCTTELFPACTHGHVSLITYRSTLSVADFSTSVYALFVVLEGIPLYLECSSKRNAFLWSLNKSRCCLNSTKLASRCKAQQSGSP